jgi:hypothetical protein
MLYCANVLKPHAGDFQDVIFPCYDECWERKSVDSSGMFWLHSQSCGMTIVKNEEFLEEYSTRKGEDVNDK